MIRKVANILLKDIVSGRASRVKKEFSDVLSPEDEAAIVAAFAGREHSLDDDINLSLDQTERLAREIRSGRLHYPAIRIGGKADYNELRNFLERLCDIFKWETYEYDTLGFRNKSSGAHTKLSHYAFVLNQWVSGMSLNHMVTDSIDYYRSTGKGKVKLKGQYVAFKDEAPYVNALISGMLEDIEDVILFGLQTTSSGFRRNTGHASQMLLLPIGTNSLSTAQRIRRQYGCRGTASPAKQQLILQKNGASTLPLTIMTNSG